MAEPHVRVDPSVQGGQPVIDGTRIPTLTIAGMVANGTPIVMVVDCYPPLDRRAVLLACWFEAWYGRYGGLAMRDAR